MDGYGWMGVVTCAQVGVGAQEGHRKLLGGTLGTRVTAVCEVLARVLMNHPSSPRASPRFLVELITVLNGFLDHSHCVEHPQR